MTRKTNNRKTTKYKGKNLHSLPFLFFTNFTTFVLTKGQLFPNNCQNQFRCFKAEVNEDGLAIQAVSASRGRGFYLNLNSLLVTRQMTLFHQGVRMGGEINPLNARVKRTWTHSHQTFQQRRQVNQGGHSSP